jgi:hypothetical protein
MSSHLNNLVLNWEDGFGGGLSDYSKKSIKVDRVEQMIKIQEEAKSLFKRKNADYGDAFADYGTVGVLVRMGDKIRRLQSISNKGINLVKDESLRDTLIDLHNYAAMAIMLLDEKDESNKKENSFVVDDPTNIVVSEAGMGQITFD